MLRFVFALASLAPYVFCQTLPSFNWDQRIDNSGLDIWAGMGTDSQGNVYVAGSTLSPTFSVKSAVQANLASAGLYVIYEPDSAYSHVGTNWVITSLAADPATSGVLFGVSLGAGVKSVDGGNTWSVLPIPSTAVQAFAIDPSNGQNVYAAAYDIGFLKSTDAGATWNTINNGLIPSGEFGAYDVWIDPNFPNVIFASYGNYLIRSADAGANWQQVGPLDGLFNLYFETPEPGVIYLMPSGYGVFKSVDDGQTFQAVNVPVTLIFADPRAFSYLT
ncbi:MAG: SBBP repeat-containing protein [Bryobacteraceae bacterium]